MIFRIFCTQYMIRFTQNNITYSDSGKNHFFTFKLFNPSTCFHLQYKECIHCVEPKIFISAPEPQIRIAAPDPATAPVPALALASAPDSFIRYTENYLFRLSNSIKKFIIFKNFFSNPHDFYI
jgi:hypothetical protein